MPGRGVTTRCCSARWAINWRTSGGDDTNLAIADVTRHAWVQLQQDDGTWLDLDPTMPDAQPGDTLTAAGTTADKVADTDVQMIGLRVAAEMLTGGELISQELLAVSLPTWDVAERQILISFTPEAGSGPLGGPGGLLGGGGSLEQLGAGAGNR